MVDLWRYDNLFQVRVFYHLFQVRGFYHLFQVREFYHLFQGGVFYHLFQVWGFHHLFQVRGHAVQLRSGSQPATWLWTGRCQWRGSDDLVWKFESMANIFLQRYSLGPLGCRLMSKPTGWRAATIWGGSPRGLESTWWTTWTCSPSCCQAWASPTRGRRWAWGTRTSRGRRPGTLLAVRAVLRGTKSAREIPRGPRSKWISHAPWSTHQPHPHPNPHPIHQKSPLDTKLQWSNESSAGFSNSLSTWLPVNPNYVWLNLADQVRERLYICVFICISICICISKTVIHIPFQESEGHESHLGVYKDVKVMSLSWLICLKQIPKFIGKIS